MLAAGDTLYLAQGDAGVLCMDISLPDHPTWIGQKKTGGCCIDLAAGGNGEIYLLNKGQSLGYGSEHRLHGQGSGQNSGSWHKAELRIWHKAVLRADLRAELRADLSADLRAELRAELRAGISARRSAELRAGLKHFGDCQPGGR